MYFVGAVVHNMCIGMIGSILGTFKYLMPARLAWKLFFFSYMFFCASAPLGTK